MGHDRCSSAPSLTHCAVIRHQLPKVEWSVAIKPDRIIPRGFCPPSVGAAQIPGRSQMRPIIGPTATLPPASKENGRCDSFQSFGETGECRVGTEVAVANLPKVRRTGTECVWSPRTRTCTRIWLHISRNTRHIKTRFATEVVSGVAGSSSATEGRSSVRVIGDAGNCVRLARRYSRAQGSTAAGGWRLARRDE